MLEGRNLLSEFALICFGFTFPTCDNCINLYLIAVLYGYVNNMDGLILDIDDFFCTSPLWLLMMMI